MEAITLDNVYKIMQNFEKLDEQIYLNGVLQYEIETFSDHDECEIIYYR